MRPSIRKARLFLRDVWQLTAPYWRSVSGRQATIITAALLASVGFTVYVEVQYNEWNKNFFDALEHRNVGQFWAQIGVSAVLAVCFIACAAATRYLSQWLEMSWRTWLTHTCVNDWLSDHAFYLLQACRPDVDNPDQRIAEDIKSFVALTISLTTHFISSTLMLGAFLAILWNVSQSLSLQVGTAGVVVPKYMVWVAFIYAFVGTWLAYRTGRALVPLTYAQQHHEADYRYALVRLRENAEQVVMYGGEPFEQKIFNSRFDKVRLNWFHIMGATLKLTVFTNAFTQLSMIFPFLLAMPKYFSGDLNLGGLMQTASAFHQVEGSLAFFVGAYAQLTEWKAVVNRLRDFGTAARDVSVTNKRSQQQDFHPESESVVLTDVDVTSSDGTAILKCVSGRLDPGGRVLLSGVSGAGKTSLLRVIAGAWPIASGHISYPHDYRPFFIPQKPYMPIGTLRECLNYPSLADSEDASLHEVLEQVLLQGLCNRLNECGRWGQLLSPGEQQRLAIGRALLWRPTFLFFDEGLSALDEGAANHLLALLNRALPDAAIFGVDHNAAHRHFFHELWSITTSGQDLATLERSRL